MRIHTVSFDFFDTLYSRRILNPDSVIRLSIFNSIDNTKMTSAQGKINLTEHLFQLRKKIESDFYADLNFKVSLNDIYYHKEFLSEFSIEFSNLIIKNEISLEMNNLYPRKDVHNYARKMFNSNKTLLLVSDTYHTEEFIYNRLKQDDLEQIFSGIYVSSKNGLRKDTKEIYRYLINELNLPPKSWLHVGDNEFSDIENAEFFGIRTLTVFKPQDNLGNWYPVKTNTIIENFLFDYMIGISNDFFLNRSFKKNELKSGIDLSKFSYFDFGYYILGPIFYGYIFEIITILQEKSFNVIFLSREGCYFSRLIRNFIGEVNEDNILIEYPYNRLFTLDETNSNEIKSFLSQLINPNLDLLFIDIGYAGTMSKRISSFFPNMNSTNFFFLKWPQNNESDSSESYIKGLYDKSLIDYLFRKSSIFEFFLSAPLGELVFSKIHNKYERYNPYTIKEENIIMEVQSGIEQLGRYFQNLGFGALSLRDTEKELLLNSLMKITSNAKFAKIFFRNLFILNGNIKMYLAEEVLDFMNENVYSNLRDFKPKYISRLKTIKTIIEGISKKYL